MPWLAPSAFVAPAPTHALRWLMLILAGLAGLAFLLAVLNPLGVLPGIADAQRSGNTVTLNFDAGDRYFWLPSTPQPAIRASELLQALPGSQALVQRANYQDSTRQAYDEEQGGDNFELHPDFLYEVHGLLEDGHYSYTDSGHATGRDYLDEIRGSHTVLQRVWRQVLSIPAVVLDDLQHVGDDVAHLFDDNAEQPGALHRATTALHQHWPLMVAVILLLVLAPLAGAGPLSIGIIGALILISGRSSPFYWLAGASIAFGVLLDRDGPRQALGRLGLKGAVNTGAFAYEYPRAAQGLLIYLGGAILCLALAYFGHVQLLAIVLLATGTAAIFLMARPGEENSTRPLSGMHIVPGILVALLGLVNGSILLFVGFAGFGMAFLVLSTVVGYQVVLRHIRDKRRLNQEYLHALGQGRRPGEPWEKRVQAGVSRYVEGMAQWTKIAYAVILLFAYLSMAAAARGDWLTFATHLLVGVVALIATWLLGRKLSERNLEESP